MPRGLIPCNSKRPMAGSMFRGKMSQNCATITDRMSKSRPPVRQIPRRATSVRSSVRAAIWPLWPAKAKNLFRHPLHRHWLKKPPHLRRQKQHPVKKSHSGVPTGQGAPISGRGFRAATVKKEPERRCQPQSQMGNAPRAS